MLGCIADDFTGATDLAGNLVQAGMRVVQTIGMTAEPVPPGYDAIVVALKTRTIASKEAVSQSLAAARWLRDQGATQFYFKYCSTFDSTPQGNIGPVTDALMTMLGTEYTIACPAFPATRRTICNGWLFVDGQPLHESGMRDHPLTPMTDSDLVRVLQAQTARQVGLIDHRVVAQGSAAISAAMDMQERSGVAISVVDILTDDDLRELALACKAMPLVTAGSGLAVGLPAARGIMPTDGRDMPWFPHAEGPAAIISGSCSKMTNAQVASFLAKGGAAFRIKPAMLDAGEDAVRAALDWAEGRMGDAPILFYSTADPAAVRQAQGARGTIETGNLVEAILSGIARGLAARGLRRLIVAGGETSGACVNALKIGQLVIGPQICPGVPWTHAPPSGLLADGLHLALKSGNFGDADFFTDAFEVLP